MVFYWTYAASFDKLLHNDGIVQDFNDSPIPFYI